MLKFILLHLLIAVIIIFLRSLGEHLVLTKKYARGYFQL